MIVSLLSGSYSDLIAEYNNAVIALSRLKEQRKLADAVGLTDSAKTALDNSIVTAENRIYIAKINMDNFNISASMPVKNVSAVAFPNTPKPDIPFDVLKNPAVMIAGVAVLGAFLAVFRKRV